MALLCPRCGTPNRAHAVDCVRCGSMLAERLEATDLDVDTPPSRRRPKPSEPRERRDHVDFLEDETLMNPSAESTPRRTSDRPPISAVGFNRRGMATDRADTVISPLASEPWEDIVDAAVKPRREKQTAPTAVPLLEKKRPELRKPAQPAVPPARKAPRAPPPESSLDADTDEGVVQVPPDELPAFGIDPRVWPSGKTKPLAPALQRTPPRKSDLLENKPVTGARPPARAPAANEQTRFGALIPPGKSAPQGGETIAAPGELAGLLDGLPKAPMARAELVDDLLSPAALRRNPPDNESSAPLDSIFAEREHRKREMQRSVETTSPEELRRLRLSQLPDLGADVEDTRDVLPPHRLEETRAFAENPLAQPAGISGVSGLLPLPAVEDTLKRADARPFGQTQVVLRLSSGTRRLLALAIDAIVLLSLVLVPALLGVFGEGISTADWLDPDDVSRLLMQGELTLPLVLLTVLGLLASALGHGLTGRSLGKLICGLELVQKKSGARAGPARAIIRALLSLVSLLLGGAGYLWLIVDRRARTLHDHLTGTVVVLASSRTQGSRADESFAHEPTL